MYSDCSCLLDHDITPRGIISVRKSNGEYIVRSVQIEEQSIPREQLHIVYVGRYSYFSGHQASPWGARYCDKILLRPEPPATEGNVLESN